MGKGILNSRIIFRKQRRTFENEDKHGNPYSPDAKESGKINPADPDASLMKRGGDEPEHGHNMRGKNDAGQSSQGCGATFGRPK